MLAAKIGNDIEALRGLIEHNALFVKPRQELAEVYTGKDAITCTKCVLPKHPSNFVVDRAKPSGRRRTCVQCSAYSRYKHRHFERLEVLNHYGAKCACCDSRFIPGLTIDHIGGMQGKKRVSQPQLYHAIIADNFPNSIQVLCMNCNLAVSRIDQPLCILRDRLLAWREQFKNPS